MTDKTGKTGKMGTRPRITNGFVFKSVFGERPELCKELLEISLDTTIASVSIVQPERELEVAPRTRGGRVDVLVVDGEGNRYDVEIQAGPGGDECLRARHYQALMDVTQLQKGSEVKDLRNSVVLFICDFDPFTDGLQYYDCRTVCLGTGAVVPDGRRSVYLNARGSSGEVNAELQAFLALVRGDEEVHNSFVDEIRSIISKYAEDAGWMEAYVTLEEQMEIERRASFRAGRLEGLAEGLAEGRLEGLAEGLAEGRLRLACDLVREGTLDAARAAELAGASQGEVLRALGQADG